MRSEVMIAARDVEASSAWYQRLLDARSDHGGREYDRIVRDGELLLQLHHLDADEHPALAAPGRDTAGAGVLILFRVDDVHAVYERAVEMGTPVLDAPHRNPKAGHLEFSLRDPDGYALTICG